MWLTGCTRARCSYRVVACVGTTNDTYVMRERAPQSPSKCAIPSTCHTHTHTHIEHSPDYGIYVCVYVRFLCVLSKKTPAGAIPMDMPICANVRACMCARQRLTHKSANCCCCTDYHLYRKTVRKSARTPLSLG